MELEVFNTVITLDIYQFTIWQVRVLLEVLILLFVSISKSKPFGVLEVSNFIVSVNSLRDKKIGWSLGSQTTLTFDFQQVADSCHLQSWPIQMSHWRHTMVNGIRFWIGCQWLAFLRILSCWQLVQSSAPSSIAWRQCVVWIGFVMHLPLLYYLVSKGKASGDFHYNSTQR